MPGKMTVRQYDEMIRTHIARRDYVKIKRTVTEGEANINGFILQMSRDFLLIQKEEEFYFNGYAIIRKDHFDAMRCNKSDKAFKRMLKAEGILDADYGIGHKLRLINWKTIFQDLKKEDYHVIVECEDLQDPLFVIGPITSVSNDAVSIRYYDTTGLLDKKPTRVKFRDITLVKFDDRYMNVFRKYLRKR